MGWGREMPVMTGGLDAEGDEEFSRIKEVAVVALSDGLRSVEEVERMQEIFARNHDEHERLVLRGCGCVLGGARAHAR